MTELALRRHAATALRQPHLLSPACLHRALTNAVALLHCCNRDAAGVAHQLQKHWAEACRLSQKFD